MAGNRRKKTNRYADELNGEAQTKLRAWGEWSKIGVGQVFGSGNPLAIRSAAPDPAITDDEALQVDFAVRLVRDRSTFSFEVLRQYYIERRFDSEIAENLRRNRMTIAMTRHKAEGFVAGILEILGSEKVDFMLSIK